MLVIETVFSNRQGDLACRSLHLAPQSLAVELSSVTQCGAPYPIYITHSKPAEANLILREIGGMGICREIRPLVAGDLHEV